MKYRNTPELLANSSRWFQPRRALMLMAFSTTALAGCGGGDSMVTSSSQAPTFKTFDAPPPSSAASAPRSGG